MHKVLGALLSLILGTPAVLLAEPARVGVIVPLTGPLASVGTAIRRSVDLARADHPGSGAIKVIFEDDGYVPRQSVSAARKLIAEDRVSAIITFGSGPSLAVAEITEQAKIPMLAMAIVPSVTQLKDFVVRFFPSVELEGKLMAEEAARRGYQSIAVVSTTSDGMIAGRDAFLARTTAAITLNEEFLPAESDLRGIATKIAALKPSAVCLMLLPPQLSILTRRLRENGYTGELFGGPQLNVPTEIKAAQGTLNGAWFVNADDSGAGSYYRRFQERFGEPSLIEGAIAYAATHFVIDGVAAGDLIGWLRTGRSDTGVFGIIAADGKQGFTIPVAVGKIAG